MTLARRLGGLTAAALAVLALDALLTRAMIEHDVAGSLLAVGGSPGAIAVALLAVVIRLAVASLAIVPSIAVLVLTAPTPKAN